MQTDIIRAIAANAGDLECHESSRYASLDEAIDSTGARVVVTGGGMVELPARFEELLFRHPRLWVLAIGDDGRSALHRLRPTRKLLEDLSSDELLATIRAVAATAA